MHIAEVRVQIASKHWWQAPTWDWLVEAADDHDPRLIVLGSHGRSGLSGVVVGSVAESAPILADWS